MKLSNLLQRLLKRSKPKSAKIPEPVQLPKVSESAAQNMLGMISQTREVELSCDEVHQLLDEFAERVRRGEDVAQAMPLVKQHIEMCPDCREEFEALMRILLQE